MKRRLNSIILLAIGFGECFSQNRIVENSYKQRSDSIKYYDYSIVLNVLSSRTNAWGIGVEKTTPLSEKLSYATMVSFMIGKQNSIFNKQNYHNPLYFTTCIQPFHVLYGNSLKFEAGISSSIRLSRYNGLRYSADSGAIYHDVLSFFMLAGLRYDFKKQVAIKFIVGPHYQFNLRRSRSYFVYPIAGELGISWRIRKRISRFSPSKIVN